ncbi:hypothetical protein D3C81_1745430 [compost metagenome]
MNTPPPDHSGPIIKRKAINSTASKKPDRATTLPTTLSKRSGVVVRQVIRSYIRLISFIRLYLESPNSRSACSTSISVVRRAKVFARMGIKVLRSWQFNIASIIWRR